MLSNTIKPIQKERSVCGGGGVRACLGAGMDHFQSPEAIFLQSLKTMQMDFVGTKQEEREKDEKKPFQESRGYRYEDIGLYQRNALITSSA